MYLRLQKLSDHEHELIKKATEELMQKKLPSLDILSKFMTTASDGKSIAGGINTQPPTPVMTSTLMKVCGAMYIGCFLGNGNSFAANVMIVIILCIADWQFMVFINCNVRGITNT